MTDQHLTGYFEDQVQTLAEQLAVRSGSGSMTYGDLDAQANGVAARLLDLTAGADTRVALLTDQEPRGCAALLGILKSGATCVPISQSEPPDRMKQIIQDSETSAIVTHAPYLETVHPLSSEGCEVLDLEDVAPLRTRDFPLPSSDDLTFILYTSGSTGRPKGVLQTSTGSVSRAHAWRDALRVTPGDRLTLFATFATGQGSSTTLLALLSGATLCPFRVREQGTMGLSTWLRTDRITVYVSSVTLFRSLAKNPDDGRGYPDLRLIRIGGERVTPHDIDLARRRFATAEIVHTYSSTETGNIAMYRVPPELVFKPDGVVPVGPPSRGATVHVVSADGRDLPRGQIGEIVVRSAALSPGYWNDPERTAQTFRPLSAAPDDRACRMGDLGRLRPDGMLEHHGRKDFRVKIRGFRIELEEVEAAITRHPAVARAAAVARARGNAVDLALVGYVQTVDGARVTPEALRTALATQLPDHMVPSMFVFLDDFPLTPSGKIDRKALPDPRSEGPTLSEQFVAPRSSLEHSIAEVWKDVLELEKVGVHDHFLEVGGDSLRATQVATRLRDVLQVEVPMRALFEAATVSELAEAIERFQDA